jgi:GNAT superfamily N-acetyltransferase
VRIREYAELTPRQRRVATGVEFSDSDPPSTLERLDRVRVRGKRFLRYESLHAVERGVPVARAGSVRIRFVTDRGEEVVCGVADVVTRADAVRRGYATALLEETHQRARAEGIRWAFLWTRKSWGAHRAYERLGYRDVYSPELALRRGTVRSRRGQGTVTGRVARRSDAALLDRLLAAAAEDRTGFSRRPEGWFGAVFRLGWRTPTIYRVLSENGRPIGYLQATADRFDVVVREVVLARPDLYPRALDYVESLARDRWIGFASTTFVRDARTEFARRRYDRVPGAHAVLMAAPLAPVPAREWAALRRTIAGRRFWLHAGDMI